MQEITSDVELIAPTEENMEEQIMKVLGNEKVKEHCLANATDIKSKCKGWFTVEQLARKIMMLDKQEQVIDLLNLLCLFQMAYRKEHKGALRYKIQLSKEDKISVLENELEEACSKVNKIMDKIHKLKYNY